MPTYAYKREDGSTFEIDQKITEDPLVTCPTTGQKVKRIISGGAGLVFKGSGFYLTDYVKNNGDGASKSTEKKDSPKGDDAPSSSSSENTSSSSESTSSKESSTSSTSSSSD